MREILRASAALVSELKFGAEDCNLSQERLFECARSVTSRNRSSNTDTCFSEKRSTTNFVELIRTVKRNERDILDRPILGSRLALPKRGWYSTVHAKKFELPQISASAWQGSEEFYHRSKCVMFKKSVISRCEMTKKRLKQAVTQHFTSNISRPMPLHFLTQAAISSSAERERTMGAKLGLLAMLTIKVGLSRVTFGSYRTGESWTNNEGVGIAGFLRYHHLDFPLPVRQCRACSLTACYTRPVLTRIAQVLSICPNSVVTKSSAARTEGSSVPTTTWAIAAREWSQAA